MMPRTTIPPSLIGTAGPFIANAYTHDRLNSLFWACGFPGDPPDGTKLAKCQDWLRRANADCDDPLSMFGRLIAEFMDTEPRQLAPWEDAAPSDPRDAIHRALAAEGLTYRRGGYIMGGALTGPSRSLGDRLKAEGLRALETEFDRAYLQVEVDPPAALTAACAILESVCKTYLEAEGHSLPTKQVLAPLWSETAAHLGLSPKDLPDQDMKQVLSGLTSIATGIAALRTHAGSAHGHADGPTATRPRPFRPAPRHARLAVHAAHTMALFVLETWEERRKTSA